MDINKVTLLGSLVRDTVSRELPSGQAVTTFSVATTYGWRDAKSKERRETVEYHSVVAWGRLAEIIARYVKKGHKVYLEGRLQSRAWKDKEGRNHRLVQVLADNLIMLGGRQAKEQNREGFTAEESTLEEVK